MAKVFLVTTSVERWRPYNKVYNVVAVCATREAAVKEANSYIAQSHRIAVVTHGNENGFEYLGGPLEESDLFSSSALIGDITYYDEFPFSKTYFDDGHRKGQWSVHIEEFPVRE